jgi:hypothetical protein
VKLETLIPDIEIVVNAAGSNVALVAFYAPDHPHEDWEIVAGVGEISDLVHLRASLQAAIQALNATDWFTVDELDTGAVPEKNDPPF